MSEWRKRSKEIEERGGNATMDPRGRGSSGGSWRRPAREQWGP